MIFSEAMVPAFADEVGGEFSSVQESGLKSYTSNRGEDNLVQETMESISLMASC
jgi:hypothetical protein